MRAAALMYAREESEYLTAKRKAAGQLRIDWKYSPKDLPSNAEIREQVLLLANMLEGERRGEDLRDMRLLALQTMRLLEPFRPRLIGSTLTGHVRKGSDIDLHVFTDHLPALTDALDGHGLAYTIEQKNITKLGKSNVYTHVHLDAKYPIELTVYTRAEHRTVFRSSITGKPIERANLNELEDLVARRGLGRFAPESGDGRARPRRRRRGQQLRDGLRAHPGCPGSEGAATVFKAELRNPASAGASLWSRCISGTGNRRGSGDGTRK